MDIDKNNLRKKLLKVVEKEVTWIPPTGRERISAMIELRPDWCLSRQRYWGVPIPALVCNKCQKEFLDLGVIDSFTNMVAKEGSDSWFIKEIKDFLPTGLKCPHCQGADFKKGLDIIDVWFDSGVSHQAVLKKRTELDFPCELYLEGSDQHRGWFQSSLIPSMAIDNQAPYKAVLTHGHVVDSEGRKMSKSLGNVISPQDIIKDYGADVLRLWVAASDYNEDIRISAEMIKRLAEAYRKIRNTARFILSNLYDFNPDTDKMGESDLRKIDRWILREANILLLEVQKAYDSFYFYRAYQSIYDFCNQDLSMYYLDMIKGRLYTYAAKSNERKAAQTAIYEVLNILVRVMAPILAFTAEEIWRSMPKEMKDFSIASVHLLDWPRQNKVETTKEITDFDLGVISYIPYVAKALEEKRVKGEIGSSFDAKINLLTNNSERYTFLESLQSDLCEIFKVSQVDIVKQDNLDSGLSKNSLYPDIAIEVFKAEGQKCERCWNYSLSVGKDKEHSLICENCLLAIGGK